MAECDNNPQTPVYSKAAPVINENCINCGNGNVNNFYNPVVVGKTAEVLAGSEIAVEDLSDSAVDRFRVSYDPVEQLVVDLSLIARDSLDVAQALPVLKGVEVQRIDASWAYNNQAVVSQQLSSVLSDPLLGIADRSYNYTGLTVNEDTSITISGDTGEGYDPESTDDDTKTVTFGNYLAWGAAASADGLAEAAAQSYLNGFIGLSQVEIRRNRLGQALGIGGTNEKFFFLYPKSFGLATDFYRNPWVFGMYRVKLTDGGILRHTLLGGETEVDLILDNGTGFTEAFYMYETFADKMAHPTPIEIR